jgi:ankyrin repeat protein
MEYLCARIVKWKRKKTTHKNTRIDEFSLQLFDAIYENKFELSKILIDDGKVDVNIKKGCGDTPLIATCQQTTLQNEEEAVKFIHYLWQSGSKFHTSDNLGKTAMDYAKGNGLMKIVQTLLYIHWNILYDNVCNVGLI